MSSGRALAGGVVLTTAALVLVACQSPNPSATVVSGNTSVNREALCWSAQADKAPNKQECALPNDSPEELADYVAQIPVLAGRTVGISVDTEVAESGWSVTVNGRPLNSQLIKGHYYRFALSEQNLRKGSLQLEIFAATEDGEQTRGNWIFELKPQD